MSRTVAHASPVLDAAEAADLDRAYVDELDRWLRSRFRLLASTYLLVVGVDLLLLFLTAEDASATVLTVPTVGRAASLLVILYFLRRPQGDGREATLQAAGRMIMIVGGITVASFLAYRLAQGAIVEGPMLVALFLWHFSACLFLPWSPGESLRPLVPLYVAWAMLALVLPKVDVWWTILLVICGPVIFLPGLAVTAWRLRRHSERFRWQLVGQWFHSMRQEVTRARSIHESLFPDQIDGPRLRFTYTYTPMQQLGGDFVHLHQGGPDQIDLVLLDVTGHGLSAALTVNRVSGELERIRAEAPDAEPGLVIELLNRYFNLTLSRHAVYASALAVRIDAEEGTVSWSNAGHPPAFLRRTNGDVITLDATTTMLGMLDPDAFTSSQATFSVTPGDTLVLYTDGVIEARDRHGVPFGLQRLQDLVARDPAPTDWPRFLAARVDRHHAGRYDDDILIAALAVMTPSDVPASE